MGKEPIPNIPLPQGWQPGPLDVVICKGKRFRHHAGNQRLRQICETRLADYQNASKMQKSVIITEVVDVVRKQGGKWVKPSEGAQAAIVGDVDDINWVLAEDLLCREKSGASFRDVMRSSSKTTSSSYTRQGSAPNLMLSSSSSIKSAGSAKDLLESFKMAKIGSNSDIQRCLSAGTLMLSKRPSSGQFSQAKKASFSKLQDANCKNNITQGGGSKNATWSTTGPTSSKARSKSPNPLLARSMMAGFRSNSNKNLMENVRSNSQRNLMANGRSGSQRNLMANGRSGSQRNLMANGRSGSQRNLMANGRSNSRRQLQLSPANSQRDLMAGFRSHMGRMLPNNNNPQPPPPQVQAQPQAQASPTLVNLQSQIDQMQQQLQKLQQSNLGIGPTTSTTTQARPLDQFQSQLNQMQQQLQNHPTGPTITTSSTTTTDPVKLLQPVDPVKSHHEDSDSHFSLEGIDFGGKDDPLMDFSIQSVESANANASAEHLQQAELILQQAAQHEQVHEQHQHDSEEFCLPGIDLDEGVPTTTSNPMAAW